MAIWRLANLRPPSNLALSHAFEPRLEQALARLLDVARVTHGILLRLLFALELLRFIREMVTNYVALMVPIFHSLFEHF